MTDQMPFGDMLCERIRAASSQAKLCPLSELEAFAAESRPELSVSGSDDTSLGVEALLADTAHKDIHLMRGSVDTYYFSELSMTEAYAKHLYRVAERDPLKLIADTTRDESRMYPRPTPASSFRESPFLLSEKELEEALLAMKEKAEYSDIQSTKASNGELYLFSTQSLVISHAESLAEWMAVGIAENP
ncbi:MAG TPA: hypothetical protein DCG47_00085 [Spirochaetaceae bacterium]|nr:hypothetical protein [Spirochaetaceae bacterium]